MTIRRRTDLACSTLLVIVVCLCAVPARYPLFDMPNYLIAILVATFLPGLVLRPQPLFLSGCTAASMASLLFYMTYIGSQRHTEAFFVIGHLLSLPGILVGGGLAGLLVRLRGKTLSPWQAALIGFAGAGAGFLLIQLSMRVAWGA